MSGKINVITNGNLDVSVSSFGAQLQSIKQNNIEYLWQGDSKWWSRRAPILFPFVGKLRDDHATSAQGDINLPQHGLARNLEHELEGETTSSVHYLLTSTNETKKNYPYDFELRVSYLIDENSCLHNTFEVTNTGTCDMPYNIGGHPAFNCPLQDNEDFRDYEIRFSQAWTYDSPTIDFTNSNINPNKTFNLLDNSDTIKVTHELFDCDTLLLKDIPNSFVEMVSTKTGHGVQLKFDDFKYFGIWSAKNNAPFVALEPWCGCNTLTTEDDVFEHKTNTQVLAPGETKTYTFTMKFI